MAFEYFGSILQMLTGGVLFVASILMWKFRNKPEIYKTYRRGLIFTVAISSILELGFSYFIQKRNSEIIFSLKKQIECRSHATVDFSKCKSGVDSHLCQGQFDEKVLICEKL
jgi:hypothetical protein